MQDGLRETATALLEAIRAILRASGAPAEVRVVELRTAKQALAKAEQAVETALIEAEEEAIQ